jgi:dTDP-4-dehydrorhamnose reductase
MVPLLKGLATTGQYRHPVLSTKGWWDREERYEYKNEISYISTPRHQVLHQEDNQAPILITGATGTLGQAFGRICKTGGLALSY